MFEIGDRVDYHSVIGGEITIHDCEVTSKPYDLNGTGVWVCKIDKKAGVCAVDALTPYDPSLNKYEIEGEEFEKIIDSLLYFTDHSRRSCKESDPYINYKDDCTRCALLRMKNNGWWDSDYEVDIRLIRVKE